MPRPTQPWQRKMAKDLLDLLGVRQTSRMRMAVIAWHIAECGDRPYAPRNNPFNIFHKGKPVEYPTLKAGLEATARTLAADPKFSKWAGYDKVVKYAKNNDPVGFMAALAQSRWDAGRYGTLKGGPNLIVTVYKELVDGLPGEHWLDRPPVSGEEQ